VSSNTPWRRYVHKYHENRVGGCCGVDSTGQDRDQWWDLVDTVRIHRSQWKVRNFDWRASLAHCSYLPQHHGVCCRGSGHNSGTIPFVNRGQSWWRVRPSSQWPAELFTRPQKSLNSFREGRRVSTAADTLEGLIQAPRRWGKLPSAAPTKHGRIKRDMILEKKETLQLRNSG
jgi:hypothetical protein